MGKVMSRFSIIIVLLSIALTVSAYQLRTALGTPFYGLLIVILGISVLVGWLDWVAKKPATSKWKTTLPILVNVPTVHQIPLLERLGVLAFLLLVAGVYYIAAK
jgi:hypothetical protein